MERQNDNQGNRGRGRYGRNRFYRRGDQQNQPQQPQQQQEAQPQQAPVQQQQQPAEPAQNPQPIRENRAPPPRHLATKQTPLKNDPMYLDAFVIEGEQGLIQEPRVELFSNSFDSFLPLVRADYLQLVAANRPFGKEVSQSVYTYYCIQHLWARITAIKRHRRQLTWEETQFLEAFEHDALPTTQPINDYLRSFGDFSDTTGTNHGFFVPSPNEFGHFGRINAENHNLYEAYPAPFISLTRIIREYEFDGDEPVWEIDELRPAEAIDREYEYEPEYGPENIGEDALSIVSGVNQEEPAEDQERLVFRDMPTVNLLGWALLQRLTANQRQFITPLYQEDFVITNPRFQFVPDLMTAVANRLAGLLNYKIASTLHVSKYGSKAQEAFLQIERFGAFNRAKYYCDGEESRVRCLSVIDSRLATGMRVFGLRIRKDSPPQEPDNYRPWACYDFGRYEFVPDTWSANRNRLFNNGLSLLTHANKSTVIADRRPFRSAVLRTAIKERNRV